MSDPKLHVEPCPTCHGNPPWLAHGGGQFQTVCAKCKLVPGYRVPEWVKVPMMLPYTDPCPCGGDHADPDWRWQPGTEIPVTANCPDVKCGDIRVGPCPRCGNHNGPRAKVTVGTVRIAELVPVIENQHGRPITKVCVEVVSDSYRRLWYWGEEYGQWQHRRIDIDCEPGDTLARLETS